MPSFSTISVFATLALAAFTSAVPTAAPAVDLEVRAVDLKARQASTVLTDLLSAVTGPAATITTTSNPSTISTALGAISTAFQGATSQINADPTVLTGLSSSDCITQLTGIMNVIGPCLTIVSGCLSGGGFGSADITLLTGLVVLILQLVAELIILVITIVPCLPIVSTLVALVGGLLGGLLTTVITLVIGLITPVCGTILSGCLPVFTSCGLGALIGVFGVAGSFPTALGGTLSLVACLTPILTIILPVLCA